MVQGGCPPIDEHQEWSPPVTQQHVILPNPGYKIEANIWHLNVKESALRPGPIASFLRHCNTILVDILAPKKGIYPPPPPLGSQKKENQFAADTLPAPQPRRLGLPLPLRTGKIKISETSTKLWTVHRFQVISEVVLSQQTTLSISVVKLPWRIFENFKGMQRGFSLKRHVFVYGQMSLKIRLWTRQRRSRIGCQECLVTLIACVESNLHGFVNCKLNPISSLQCLWPHLQVRRRHRHHPVQLPMSQ